MACGSCGGAAARSNGGGSGGVYRSADLGWTLDASGKPVDLSNPVYVSGDPSTDIVIAQVIRQTPSMPAAFDGVALPVGARVAICMDPLKRGISTLWGYLQMIGFAPSGKPITPGSLLAGDTDEWQWIGDTRVMVRDGVATHPGWS